MKKSASYLLVLLGLLVYSNVFACGEISNIEVEGATVKKVEETSYIIGIKEGTNRVYIDAKTDTEFVEGYGPREVTTDEEVKLVVNGESCNHANNVYYFTFETIKTIIAENDTPSVTTTDNDTTTNNNLPVADNTQDSNTLQLENIEIVGYQVDFTPSVYEYSLQVENISSLEINTKKKNNDDSVIVSSNAYDLEDGDNLITITVSNSNGDKGVYTFNVNKKAKVSTNNYAALISVENYALGFTPDTSEYNLKIKNEKFLNITVVTENKKATYKVTGNEKLKNNSVIVVTITAEDGSTRDYKINIKKDFDIMAYWQYIAVGGLLVLILILVALRGKNKKQAMKPAEVSPNGQANISAPIASTTLEPVTGINQTEIVGAAIEQTNQPVEQVAPVVPQAPIPENGNGLEYITPTNIEQVQAPVESNQTPTQQVNSDSYAQSNPTEVFKL